MPILMDSGNPEENETVSTCITYSVSKGELSDKEFGLLLVEKFAKILRNTKRLCRIEVDLFGGYITLYTYGEPLDKNKEDDE